MNGGRALILAVTAAVLTAALIPAVSKARPSGTDGEIAFSKPVHGVSQVFAIKPDGAGLRQITHGSSPAGRFGLSWSPDGRSLLYTVTENGKDRILKSRTDGTHVTAVSPSCTGQCLGDDNPSYSPNGNQIAFERAFGPIVHGSAAVGAIFTMDANGSHLNQLTEKKTPTSTEDHDPQWSPNGKTIAFVRLNDTAEPKHQSAIELMNADGSNVRRLTPFRLDAINPRWSPSGKQLLFDSYGDRYGESTPGKSANLFTMRIDGTHLTPLTHYAGGPKQAFAEAWSPDGAQILDLQITFGLNKENGGLSIINTHGKQIRQLTHGHATTDAEAAWSK
jgi:Tol biopolymer transport system component